VSGLEQAIRHALERAERNNPDIRSRIYQSARNALDAGLRKQDINDPAVIERQRRRLDITIREIEDEELERLRSIARLEKVMDAHEPEAEAENIAPADLAPPIVAPETREPLFNAAPEPVAAVSPPVVKPAPVLITEDPVDEPEPVVTDDGSLSGLSATRDTETRRRPVREQEDPALAEPSTPADRKISKTKKTARRRGSSLFVSLFVYSVILSLIGGGVWWVYATGMIDAVLKGKSDFDFVPKQLQAESFDPTHKANPLDPQQRFSNDWTMIFTPGKDTGVKARATADISSTKDSDGAATVIASHAPDQDGEVLIDVPADVLQQLAGKTSTLAVTVKSANSNPAQIYIQCEFGTLGECGRHRFTLTNERADELFQVKFDGKLAPDQTGHIIINSDLTGRGQPVNLYGIRVQTGE
jgi:hypothetical protein